MSSLLNFRSTTATKKYQRKEVRQLQLAAVAEMLLNYIIDNVLANILWVNRLIGSKVFMTLDF